MYKKSASENNLWLPSHVGLNNRDGREIKKVCGKDSQWMYSFFLEIDPVHQPF